MDRSVHTNLVSKSHFLAKLCKSIPFGSGTCNLYSLHCCNVTNHPSTHENGKFLCDISSQCCPTILHDSNQSVIPSFYLLQFPSLSHPKVSIYHFQSSHQQNLQNQNQPVQNQTFTNHKFIPLTISPSHPLLTYFIEGYFYGGCNFPRNLQQDPLNRTLKPENLIALSNFLRGPLVRSHSIPDGNFHFPWKSHLLHQPSKYLPRLHPDIAGAVWPLAASAVHASAYPWCRKDPHPSRGSHAGRSTAPRFDLQQNNRGWYIVFFNKKDVPLSFFVEKKDRNNFGVSFLKISVSFCSFPFWLDHSIWKKSSSPSST